MKIKHLETEIERLRDRTRLGESGVTTYLSADEIRMISRLISLAYSSRIHRNVMSKGTTMWGMPWEMFDDAVDKVFEDDQVPKTKE